MQLNIIGCEGAFDSEEFMKTDVDLFGNTVSIQFEEKE